MFYTGLAVIFIGASQAVNALALKYFGPLVAINNAGAFGIKGDSIFFGVLSVVAMAVFLYLMKDRLKNNRADRIPVTLIISGGLSNLIDRVVRHGVIDFVDFKIWPIFNVADLLITIGLIWLVVCEIAKSAKRKMK